MAISLEELKRQRAQILKHLEWLDANIREMSSANESTETTQATNLAVNLPPVDDGVPIDSETPALEAEGHLYQTKTQDELLRAKVGCLLFFALGIVLFIFLLFGLPYYL